MRRWLVLALGLGLAGLMGYALLTAGASGTQRMARPRPASPAPEPSDHIGRESREALRQILRESEREEP